MDSRYLLIKKWGRLRPLPDTAAREAAAEWQAHLGIRQEVRLERVTPAQVSDRTGRRGCSLVGVVYDVESARIFHTRLLTSEDIVHELLHVAHPDWPESQVCFETGRLLGGGVRQGERACAGRGEVSSGS